MPPASGLLTVATIALTVLLAVVIVFQVALAAGAPWGVAAYGGAHRGVLPTRLRIASGVAAALWVALGLVLLRRTGYSVPAVLPDGVLAVAGWIIFAILALSVILNAITPSVLERAIWLPVTLLLAAATLVIALAPQ